MLSGVYYNLKKGEIKGFVANTESTSNELKSTYQSQDRKFTVKQVEKKDKDTFLLTLDEE